MLKRLDTLILQFYEYIKAVLLLIVIFITMPILALPFSQELEALESGENVYKMMGPVLLRVEVEDAKQNVGKRLEMIKGSM